MDEKDVPYGPRRSELQQAAKKAKIPDYGAMDRMELMEALKKKGKKK